MAIAYLPIEIDVKLPDEERLIEFAHRYKIPSNQEDRDDVKTGNHWYKVPVCGRCESEDWYDIDKFKTVLYNRFVPNVYPVKYANEIDKKFPEIPFILNQLPFKELSFVALLMQREEVECHTDDQDADIIIDPSEVSLEVEPRRYNIQLTRHGIKSFYVCKDQGSERTYPMITKELPAFAICEKHHWHGADHVVDGKIMLSIFGILDREKHKKTIEYNLEKFKDKAIIY